MRYFISQLSVRVVGFLGFFLELIFINFSLLIFDSFYVCIFCQNEEDTVYKQDFSQPTLEDHFDKTILPKVMQVSLFVRALQ